MGKNLMLRVAPGLAAAALVATACQDSTPLTSVTHRPSFWAGPPPACVTGKWTGGGRIDPTGNRAAANEQPHREHGSQQRRWLDVHEPRRGRCSRNFGRRSRCTEHEHRPTRRGLRCAERADPVGRRCHEHRPDGEHDPRVPAESGRGHPESAHRPDHRRFLADDRRDHRRIGDEQRDDVTKSIAASESKRMRVAGGWQGQE